MEIKTKFNVGEKVFYNLNSIFTVVKNNPLCNDKEIFDCCFGEGVVVGIKTSFNTYDKKLIIEYVINNSINGVNVDDDDMEMLKLCGAMYDEDVVSNNREELEKTIHDIHIAELKMLNEKIVNLMK